MKRSLLALTLLAALPFAASATEGLSYNYVEGGYAGSTTENNFGRDVDTDGFAIAGSGEINHNFHLFGGFSSQEIDNTNVDFDQWRLGVGYNHQIGTRTDLITGVAYQKFESDYLDADGFSVEAGVRSSFSPMFEGFAVVGVEDYERSDNDFYGKVGAQVRFSPNWGISGDVKFSDGDTQYFVGPRFTF